MLPSILLDVWQQIIRSLPKFNHNFAYSCHRQSWMTFC